MDHYIYRTPLSRILGSGCNVWRFWSAAFERHTNSAQLSYDYAKVRIPSHEYSHSNI